MSGPIDDEVILSLIETCRHPDGRINSTRIAEQSGYVRASVQGRLKRLAREGRLGTRSVLPGFELKSVSEELDENGSIKRTFVKQGLASGEEFKLPEGHSIKGVSALVDADGRTVQQWIKTSASQEYSREAIISAFSEYRGKAEPIDPPASTDSALLTVYPIPDAHLGLLSWSRETGMNWDLRIAERAINSAIDQLIMCAPASETAVILNLGDFTHGDNQTNTTPASGHQLDLDGRFPKIAKAAIKIHVGLIERALQKHAKVITRILPGNHDPTVSQMVAIALALFFENNPRVEVDDDPSDFWWYRHGKVLLGANHGHKVKPSELPGVMAAYRPEDWGKSKWRYCYGGHIHHKSGGEKHGAMWETFQTIAAKDAYSHSHGYSSGRSMVSITHHEDRGEIMRQTVSV